MRRFIAVILSICLFALCFCGCTKIPEKPKYEDATLKPADNTDSTTAAAPEQAMTVRLAVSKGPAAIGMVYLFDAIDNKSALGDYTYEVLDNSKDAAEKVAAGECEIAAVSTEDALRLYSEGKDVQLIAISSYSNYYLVELGEVTLLSNVGSMTGKFYVPSGSLLEPIMKAVFAKAENNDVAVVTQFSADDLAGLVKKNRIIHAALPEPLASEAAAEGSKENVGVDVSDLWENLVRDTEYADSKICSTCIIANKDFVASHPKATAMFLKEFKASVKNVNSQTTAPALVVNYKLAGDEEKAKALIAGSSIICKTKDDMRTILGGFLTVLKDHGSSVTVPDVNFYYTKSY